MRKMATPKMDVVRFKADDVIVASGHHDHHIATLTGWGNGEAGDAAIHFKNGAEHTANIDALAGLFGNGGLNPDVEFHKTADRYATLGDLTQHEEADGYDFFNGTYEKDETNGNWYGYTRQ